MRMFFPDIDTPGRYESADLMAATAATMTKYTMNMVVAIGAVRRL